MRAAFLAVIVISAAVTSTARAQQRARPKGTVVMVWEDEFLYIAPAESAIKARAGQPVMPRAKRPFLLVRDRGDWVQVQSTSTFDTGILQTCPLPALTTFRVLLWVKKTSIAERFDLSTLPARMAPHIETEYDICRSGLPTMELDEQKQTPQPSPFDQDKPAKKPLFPSGVTAMPKGATVYWVNGEKAGQVRFAEPLPFNIRKQGAMTCIERDLGLGAMMSSIDGDRFLTLCIKTTDMVPY